MVLTDYKVKGVGADMDEAAFLAALRAAQSPVRATEARAVYSYCIARQLSTAFVLAMFRHESGMGRFGSAAVTRSWGNTRPPSFGVPDIGATDRFFSMYANWADGGVSTVARLFDHKPYQHKDTVREIIPIWAPPTENSTERYIEAVLADIEEWTTTEEPSMTVPKPPVDTSHPSPNKGGYNAPHKPEALCWHVTVGGAAGSISWLTNPASNASANYLIDRAGKIYELVPPSESAWANGQLNKPDTSNPVIKGWVDGHINPNIRTISIENERTTSANEQPGGFTEAQHKSLVALSAWLCDSLGIAPDRTHIIRHAQIDSVNRAHCPGLAESEMQAWVGEIAALVNPAPPPSDMLNPVITERVVWGGEGKLIAQTVTVTNTSDGKYYERKVEYRPEGMVLLPWKEV